MGRLLKNVLTILPRGKKTGTGVTIVVPHLTVVRHPHLVLMRNTGGPLSRQVKSPKKDT